MPPALTDPMQDLALSADNASPPKRGGKPLRQHLLDAGPIVGLVLLCIVGTVLNPDFATWDNAMNVLTRTAFIGIIAVGMCFVIISGGIEPFIVTLGTLGIFRAYITYFSNGGALTLDNELADPYGPVYYGAWLGIPS